MNDLTAVINDTARRVGLLFKFVCRMSELDFGGEFWGMQDAGWSTTITAEQVLMYSS
ncbi:hypothetical protein ACS3SW_20740 [Roseobacteraceae bacterium S113]